MDTRARAEEPAGRWRVFGLTGGIGSGKSTVAECFRSAGVFVVDADQLSREVVAPHSPGLAAVIDAFGEEYLTKEGDLDRSKLGKRIFAQPRERERLNELLHPLVRKAARAAFERARAEGVRLCCYDVPLLFETGQESEYRPVVLVWAPEEVCLTRIMARDSLSEEQARARMKSQLPLLEKRAKADYVVENTGSLEELRERALSALSFVRGLE